MIALRTMLELFIAKLVNKHADEKNLKTMQQLHNGTYELVAGRDHTSVISGEYDFRYYPTLAEGANNPFIDLIYRLREATPTERNR